jgi:NTP pyrophosphatase (non-canonical NTP hydrolase)
MQNFIKEFNKFAELAYQNAKNHGFYPTTARIMADKLFEEAQEAAEELLGNDRAGIAEELADVVLTAMSIAGANGIDLGGAIQKKHAFNLGRPYKHRKTAS